MILRLKRKESGTKTTPILPLEVRGVNRCSTLGLPLESLGTLKCSYLNFSRFLHFSNKTNTNKRKPKLCKNK